MADGPDPARIQAPGLLEEDGHDLPISPARPAIHDTLQAVLESAPVGPGHSLVRERVDENDRLCPMYPNDGRGTFFGTTLMALFNVSPFLNFLDEAVEKKAFNDPLLVGLHRLAQSFRGWEKGEETEDKQQDSVESLMKTVWACITNPQRAGKLPPFKFGPADTIVLNFITYLFERIENGELQQSQTGGDYVDLSIRFKQLFKFFNVRHTPMRCKCDQAVLRRQATQDANPTGYYLNAEVPKSMSLGQAISGAMWEKLARPRTCPECNKRTDPVHDFDKFAYLPEVLLIWPSFIDKSGLPGTLRFVTDATVTYPERLDMSAFRDDPARPGDQADCIYKLQSIINSTPRTGGPPIMNQAMYKAALRVSNTEFAQFEYHGAPDSFPDFVTFENVNEASNGVPHLLMYVRERHAGAAGSAPEVVGPPKPTKPPGGAKKAVTPPQDTYDLQRFVTAQNEKTNMSLTAFHTATIELRQNGRKTQHWMWFIFPVVTGISNSPKGQKYSIKSFDEARAYWNHPLLKDRYLELMNAVRHGPERNIQLLFGNEVDVDKFFASLTLFKLVCVNLKDLEHDTIEEVFQHFGAYLDETTTFQVIDWLEKAGDLEARAEILDNMRPPSEQSADAGDGGSGKQETSTVATNTGPSTLSTPNNNNADTKTKHSATTQQSESAHKGGHDKGHGTSTNHDSAQRIGSKLLSLADEEFAFDDPQLNAEELLEQNTMARALGRAVLGFGVPEGTAAPVATPESEKRAHRLGRHLMVISMAPNDDPPSNVPGTSASGGPVGSFGLDGSSDDPGDGADLDEEDIYKAIAIPTDPRDPRIVACEFWTLDELKREFQKEQLDWRGLRIDPDKHRMKFRKHFELERDYSIYHEGRLRQAIRDKGIRMRHGADRVDKADKAELVDALTDYDLQTLQAAAEETESMGCQSEQYESSEASGNEAWYIERERAALAANAKGEATSVQPRLAAAAARTQKRPRDEDEDYEEEGGEMTPPRGRARGPVRMRTRY
ncbi:hypothetical protein INS49_005078 [Diaporthe citri]|uniref:uncharacterized protein n=1 Tax=Diaporthe citri TaxID=83186 RepID=UPI001C7F2D5D|nr:uncharacterized protein INS49_005078 [Diaporthe citri]KAG6354107.1 hypothetical protein INS49_005078 [Diaporthe citri]